MIRLVNLSKYYYGNNSVALGLRKINLEFHTGEFVAITGESGSGKTTLLSTISGLLPYEEGEMYFNGQETSYYDEVDWEEYRKNHIAFVFQNYNLIEGYTAVENVMTSFLIQGEEKAVAREKSLQLLERVGIAEYASHRANQLSSGQKQRLAIARALAKNTEVIVADEPTGNLDRENGRQIMELFAELSKEKLVLVVTHNYEEAAPFVSRKIVICDGEVEEDIPVKSVECPGSDEESGNSKSCLGEDGRREQVKDTKTARIFTFLNMKASMGKTVILSLFLFMVSLSYLLFFGNFIANLDDTATKKYENSAFYNSDNTRIVVRHFDGSAMTEEDLELLKNMEHVVSLDKYSLVNDLYYFTEKGVDYLVTYTNIQQDREQDPVYQENIYLDSYTKFVRSSYGVTEADLAYGRLPASTNEVVIYAEDDSLLGSTFSCFFNNKRDWPINAYIRMEMTVCGILKEPTSQYYFSEVLCQALICDIIGYEGKYAFNTDFYYKTAQFYVDDSYGLAHNQVAVSEKLYATRDNSEVLKLGYLNPSKENWFRILEIEKLDEDTPLVSGMHNSSEQFIVLSTSLFEELTEGITNTQVGVFIEDYAYMDDVLSAIRGAGYEAVAPFRIGSVSYDGDKVIERLVTLGISLAAIVVLFVLEIIIAMAFMKTDKNNAFILKTMGMKQSVLARINRYMLLGLNTYTFFMALIVVILLGNVIPQVHNILIYYRFYHVFIIFAVGTLAVFVTAYLYNRYLARLLKAGSEVQV